jgi:hypothetical protein
VRRHRGGFDRSSRQLCGRSLAASNSTSYFADFTSARRNQRVSLERAAIRFSRFNTDSNPAATAAVRRRTRAASPWRSDRLIKPSKSKAAVANTGTVRNGHMENSSSTAPNVTRKCHFERADVRTALFPYGKLQEMQNGLRVLRSQSELLVFERGSA